MPGYKNHRCLPPVSRPPWNLLLAGVVFLALSTEVSGHSLPWDYYYAFIFLSFAAWSIDLLENDIEGWKSQSTSRALRPYYQYSDRLYSLLTLALVMYEFSYLMAKALIYLTSFELSGLRVSIQIG